MSSNIKPLKKLNKELLQLAQMLLKVSEIKVWFIPKYVNEGIFETTESTRGSDSSNGHVMNYELEMKKVEIQLNESKLEYRMMPRESEREKLNMQVERE